MPSSMGKALCFIVSACVPLGGARADDPPQDDGTAGIEAKQVSNDERGPSLEFLEFLGEWDSDGEWIDPTEIEDLLAPADPSSGGAP